MDESAAASIKEDEAKNRSCGDGSEPANSTDSLAEDADNRNGVFCCQHCGENFQKEAALLEHRHQHLQQNMCLGDHIPSLDDAKNDSATGPYCTSCSLSFIDMSEFNLHLKKHDEALLKDSGGINSGGSKQQSYECLDCGKSYVVIGHFLNHQRSHRQPSKSVFHELDNLKKKSFQCETCGRSYSRASALDAHRRCHEEKLIKSKNKSSGETVQIEPEVEVKSEKNQTETESEKPYRCLCGKAFSTILRLKTHQRFSRNSQCALKETKHKAKKGSNEFFCSECKKAFNGHIALFNHQKWHANHSHDSAKRFACEECGKEFMSLTFYYRHQRTVHSDETPSKSFLHQVCQLQKKAFECKDCGLKFSRESALHSHQLQHTDVFQETEKETPTSSSLSPPHKVSESVEEVSEPIKVFAVEKVQPGCLVSTDVMKESHISEVDEDIEGYEPGDFNVLVISASESEEEIEQVVNPDLELLCESDQEERDNEDIFSSIVSKPQTDLKIIQIDFEQVDGSEHFVKEPENEMAEERYDCPDCHRWFTRRSSLHAHRRWHERRRRSKQTQSQPKGAYTCQTCGHEAGNYNAHYRHMQAHHGRSPINVASNHEEGSEIKELMCNECGKSFSHLSALVSHQLHHPKKKQFQCPDCMVSYSHGASLFNHMKTCTAQKRESLFTSKKVYNPKKTLLGPKTYHCEQCGKGFWSLGAFSHHKQNQTECVDLRLRKGIPGSLDSINGRSRSGIKVACPVCGRKFSHKGIMALHMRKHENGNHKCELCNRSFRLFSSLLRHEVVHSDQLFPPPIKSFQHQMEQLKKNTYSCPDCGKLFSRAKALQFHMKSHGYETGHDQSSSALLETLQCARCLAHFSNKASLKAHQKLCFKRENMESAKTEPPDEASTMQNDMKKHSDSLKALTDPSCGRELGSETDFGSADNPSSADLKYKCDKCDRSFSVAGALNFHKRIHASKSHSTISLMFKKSKKGNSNKGNFPCSECGRRFTTNSALGSHKRWHKEKKCSQSLLEKANLKPAKCKVEDGPFQCFKCDKHFFNYYILQSHQFFNPHCQTETMPDSEEAVQNDSTPQQFSLLDTDSAVKSVSPQAVDLDDIYCKSVDTGEHHEDNQFEPIKEQEIHQSTLKPKVYECPLCSMTFAKARGLHAHKWQAHSQRTRKKKKLLNTKQEPIHSNSKTALSGPLHDGGKKQIKSDSQPITALDCRNPSSSLNAPSDHKKESLEVKQGSKLEIQTSTSDVFSPPSHLSENSIKYYFKCERCGKAFQTGEQLRKHKLKAKTRPFCCALCCHGFWAENQLQQHLAWHDEVRLRLPNEVRLRLSTSLASKLSRTSDGGNGLLPSTVQQPMDIPATQAHGGH